MHAVIPIEMKAELGITRPMSSSYAVRWDKREDLCVSADFGWIGEGPDGIWTRRHIEAALMHDEEIQEIVAHWRCSSDRELRREDVEQLSGWYVTAWLTMLSAQNREELRRMKKGREEHGS